MLLLFKTWDFLERGSLFFAKKDGVLNGEQHLAEMVSLLGPPPLEFIRRSDKCLQYWDEHGKYSRYLLTYVHVLTN